MEKDETKAGIEAQNIQEMQDGARVYELGYLLVSSLSEDIVAKEVQHISDLILKNEGTLISSEMPVLIDLAYSMLKIVGTNRQKYSRGHFGWIKFEGSVLGLAAVKKVLDSSPTVLRYMIVKTTRENTLLNGKMMLRQEEKEEDMVQEDAEVVSEVVSNELPSISSSISEIGVSKTVENLVIA